MSNGKFKKTIWMIAVAAAFLSVASTGAACSYCYGNHGRGGYAPAPNLTQEERQKLDVVNEKYLFELDALETSLNDMEGKYRAARMNDSTTVGNLRELEAEMADLEQQYLALLDKANREASAVVPGETGPWFHCGYNGCNHLQHRASMSRGRHAGPGGMPPMPARMGGCCW